jgi:hypothetical protein
MAVAKAASLRCSNGELYLMVFCAVNGVSRLGRVAGSGWPTNRSQCGVRKLVDSGPLDAVDVSRATTVSASPGRAGPMRVQGCLAVASNPPVLVRKGSSQELGRQSDPADLME